MEEKSLMKQLENYSKIKNILKCSVVFLLLTTPMTLAIDEVAGISDLVQVEVTTVNTTINNTNYEINQTDSFDIQDYENNDENIFGTIDIFIADNLNMLGDIRPSEFFIMITERLSMLDDIKPPKYNAIYFIDRFQMLENTMSNIEFKPELPPISIPLPDMLGIFAFVILVGIMYYFKKKKDEKNKFIENEPELINQLEPAVVEEQKVEEIKPPIEEQKHKVDEAEIYPVEVKPVKEVKTEERKVIDILDEYNKPKEKKIVKKKKVVKKKKKIVVEDNEELKPEFIESVKKSMKGRTIKVKDFHKEFLEDNNEQKGDEENEDDTA
jgi:hypothetical protein